MDLSDQAPPGLNRPLGLGRKALPDQGSDSDPQEKARFPPPR